MVPTIRAAAEAAGRAEPRIAVSLPVSVTGDVDGVKERIRQEFSIYPGLPSYKAMLDREGAADAADIAFVGDEETVAAAITKLAGAGATDFVASVVGDRDGTPRLLAPERARPLLRARDVAPGQRSSLVNLYSFKSG